MRAFNEVNKGILARLLLILGLFLGHSCTTTDSQEGSAEGQTEEVSDETAQANEASSSEESPASEEQASDVAVETPASTTEAVTTPEAPIVQDVASAPVMPAIETVSAKPEVKKENAVKTFTYKVKRKDWLSKIAKRVYHDMHRWDLIYKANPRLSNPNLIIVGQKLEIPIVDASSEAFAKSYKMALNKEADVKDEFAAVTEKKSEAKLASNHSDKAQVKMSVAQVSIKAASLATAVQVTKSGFSAAKSAQLALSLVRASFVAVADLASQKSRAQHAKKAAKSV